MRKTVHQFCQRATRRIALPTLRDWSGQPLILPFYHSIRGTEPLPHIQRLYQPRSLDTFREDLDFFLQHYEPISLGELVRLVKKGEEPEKSSFFLSFDDGLREVHDLVMPLLVEKGVPATIFLNTDFVDNRGLFYRYKLSLLLERLAKNQLSKAQSSAVGALLKLEAPENALIEETLLKTTHANRQLLDEVAACLDLDFTDFLKKQRPYLTSGQIRRLMEKGFTVGAHSSNHPLYADMNLAGQLQQTKDSIRFVQRQFKQRHRAFAFPFSDQGVGRRFFEMVVTEKIADITFGTAGLKEREADFPFHFQRIPMERFAATAEAQLRGEYGYFLLKALVGRNRIER